MYTIIQNYGVPVCYEEQVEIPRLDSIEYELETTNEDRFGNLIYITTSVMESLGFPLDQSDNLASELTDYLFSEQN